MAYHLRLSSHRYLSAIAGSYPGFARGLARTLGMREDDHARLSHARRVLHDVVRRRSIPGCDPDKPVALTDHEWKKCALIRAAA